VVHPGWIRCGTRIGGAIVSSASGLDIEAMFEVADEWFSGKFPFLTQEFVTVTADVAVQAAVPTTSVDVDARHLRPPVLEPPSVSSAYLAEVVSTILAAFPCAPTDVVADEMQLATVPNMTAGLQHRTTHLAVNFGCDLLQ